MNKSVKIYNYLKQPTEVVIPKIKSVVLIICKIISGDEVLTVYYKDKTSKIFDSGEYTRSASYYDGEIVIPVERLDEFSEIKNPYNLFEKF